MHANGKFQYIDVTTTDVYEAAALTHMAERNHADVTGWVKVDDGNVVFIGRYPAYRVGQLSAIRALIVNAERTASLHGSAKRGARVSR
jgi:hypothetical protein